MYLRPATAEDRDFLLAVYASTRVDELNLTHWDSATRAAFVRQQFDAQTQHYEAHYPQAQLQVIVDQRDGQDQDAGRLWTDVGEHELHVLDISVLPFARGRGLGTHCLQGLRVQAHARGLPLGIFVEIHNPARRLYDRLGFVALGEPQGLYLQMQCPLPPGVLVTAERLPAALRAA